MPIYVQNECHSTGLNNRNRADRDLEQSVITNAEAAFCRLPSCDHGL
jgi:hypothetical protein